MSKQGFKQKLQYYVWASYRRQAIDRFLEKNASIYRGVVLDVGGRDRGNFSKPRDQVERWVTMDIAAEHKPDLVMDVADMKAVADDSIDVVNATELFEHVYNIDAGLKECHRVLKAGGQFIVSVPFLYPVHADPFDFQRWTDEKWRQELNGIGFQVERLEVSGYFFTVLADMFKALIKTIPQPLQIVFYILFPFLDLLVFCDRRGCVAGNQRLNRYHNGYFIIARARKA